MAIRTKLRRIGSSLGVLLPKKDLEAMGLKEGDLVEIPRLIRPTPRDLFGAWREQPAQVGAKAPQTDEDAS